MTKSATIAAISAASGLFLATPAIAAQGLDSDFGAGGLTRVFVGEHPDSHTLAGLNSASDGSLVLAGSTYELYVARLSSSGTVRSLRRARGNPLETLVPYALVSRSDGSFVAAGTTRQTSDRREESTVGVGAFTASAAPRSGFGVGGLAPQFAFPDASEAQARAAVVVTGQGVVVGGFSRTGSGPQLALARLGRNGALQSDFGSGGVAAFALPGTQEHVPPGRDPQTRINGLARQADGKLLAAGTVVVAGKTRAVVLRLLPDGRLDSSFGSGRGYLAFAYRAGSRATGEAISVQRRGRGPRGVTRIVVAGHHRPGSSRLSGVGVAQLQASGRFDRRFAYDGRLTTAAPDVYSVDDLALSPAGDAVVSGSTAEGITVARYSPDGRAERTFGGTGLVCTPLPGRFFDGTTDTHLVLQSETRVVFAAETLTSDNVSWFVGRYQPRFRAPRRC